MKIVITVKDTDNVIGLKEDIAMRLEGVADIVRIDTADVVPKSEVERLENTYNRAIRKIDNKTITAICNAKQEVAREIFEEIENSISPMIGLEDDKEYVAILATTFAELKKKYTEKNDGQK